MKTIGVHKQLQLKCNDWTGLISNNFCWSKVPQIKVADGFFFDLHKCMITVLFAILICHQHGSYDAACVPHDQGAVQLVCHMTQVQSNLCVTLPRCSPTCVSHDPGAVQLVCHIPGAVQLVCHMTQVQSNLCVT